MTSNSIEIGPHIVFTTEYVDHDRGGTFAGPPVIARSIDEADEAVEFHQGLHQLHPGLMVTGVLRAEWDTE